MSANDIEIDQETTTNSITNNFTTSRTIAALGAFGTALQNYPAVVLFINSMTKNMIPVTQASTIATHAASLATGGLCSGMVNFWMNVELLEDFSKRLTKEKHAKKWQWDRLGLNTTEKAIYLGGILVFMVTGILFGLMAFTFAMEGPLAILSIAAGIFVAAIMTIQEIETWLQSYDKMEKEQKLLKKGIVTVEPRLTKVEKFGQACGHIIAVGNVFALSLLFSLSLASALMTFHVTALPALITGFLFGFSFGAFTEYYFYKTYLAEFCKNLRQNMQDMMALPNVSFGIACVLTNALVNAALTYAGVEMLTSLLLAASIALPPTAAMIALATVCAFFAGTASLILGTAFWIRQYKPQDPNTEQDTLEDSDEEQDTVQNTTNVVSLSNRMTKFGKTAAAAKKSSLVDKQDRITYDAVRTLG
ncbi:MAG: hypothetical protein ACO1N3_00785 [Gammaproteobacteria bacterium]